MALPRLEIRVPPRAAGSRARLVANLLAAPALVPWYWWRAAARGAPGLASRARCLTVGAQLALAARSADTLKHAGRLMLMPMDSTRFFEFEYVEKALAPVTAHRALDVSSPRMVPVLLARARPELQLDLINPDAPDLAETRELVTALGLDARCRLHGTVVADAPFEPETFDVVTCVSVLEHIPEDTAALRRMWAWLKPGGTLVLTLPARAAACEQFIDVDSYGVLQPGADGFVFWQRYYDTRQLEQRVFSVTGAPRDLSVYGEKVDGHFARNAEQKRALRQWYPFWREPFMMADEYTAFTSVSALPGEGVVGLTFTKP